MSNKLELVVHRVRCSDGTGSGIGEWGSDGVMLGYVVIDAAGVVSTVGPFSVGDFDDDDVRRFSPPKLLARFNLHGSTHFPKAYAGHWFSPRLTPRAARVDSSTVSPKRGAMRSSSGTIWSG